MTGLSLPEIPSSKTLGFAFLGILLYLGSTYLNILKSDSATFGLWLGIILIIVALFAQIINWVIFWNDQ